MTIRERICPPYVAHSNRSTFSLARLLLHASFQYKRCYSINFVLKNVDKFKRDLIRDWSAWNPQKRRLFVAWKTSLDWLCVRYHRIVRMEKSETRIGRMKIKKWKIPNLKYKTKYLNESNRCECLFPVSTSIFAHFFSPTSYKMIRNKV